MVEPSPFSAMAALDWNPLEFFKDEIHKDNTAEVRISAVRQLKYVASVLGQDKVCGDLIPLLNKEIGLDSSGTAKDNNPLANDDEFLFQMASQYATLRDFIQPDKVDCLIQPLVHLAQQEETVIRDEAIASICTICNENPNRVRTQVHEELKNMVGKPEFTTRVSACALFGTVYKIHKTSEDGSMDQSTKEKFAAVRSELCKAYKDICADDTPMVRRASANQLFGFVKELEVEDLTGSFFLEAYKNLSKEETQDTIRVNIVNTTIEMARKIDSRDLKMEHCVPVILDACKDRSWRVRLTVARNFDEILKAFGAELAVLVDGAPQLTWPTPPQNQDPYGPNGFCLIKSLYEGLLQDAEQEVRKEAVKVIEKCLNIPDSYPAIRAGLGHHLMAIVSALVGLVSDQGQPVRAALAQALGPVSVRLGRETTNEKLLKHICDLMKDESHDVRLNIVSHAGTFCNVLGADVFMHNLLQQVLDLIRDNHWRIRKTAVEQVPRLAVMFGMEQYQSKLEALFLASLKDSVYSVRKDALSQLKSIAKAFGPQWTGDHLLAEILNIYGDTLPPPGQQQQQQQSGYASRVTVLQAIPQIWESISSEPSTHCQKVIEKLICALKDSVPNVRFCACKVITELLSQSENVHEVSRKTLIAKIKAPLKDLSGEVTTDSDSDVQYFAQQASNLCVE